MREALGDKPMLQRVIEQLIAFGCRNITLLHGDRPQAEFGGGAADANGDLAPIGDQNFFK